MGEESADEFPRGLEDEQDPVGNHIQRPKDARGRPIIKSKRRVEESPMETEHDLGG